MTEEWRPIPGWEGKYDASTFGRVRNARTGRVFVERVKSDGRYVVVAFHRNKPERPKHYSVHRLIALAFVPNPDGKPHVNHIDLNKRNNRPENLEWVTSKENHQHAVRHGLSCAATNPNKRYKLSLEDVATIKRRFAAGESGTALAREYNVVSSHIYKMIHGHVRIREHESYSPKQEER